MTPILGPREVLARLIDGVAGRQWDELPELYALDTVVTHPRGGTSPPHLELPLQMRAEDLVVHETVAPEVVIGEFSYRGRNTATSRDFAVRNVFVLRIRDGQIVESRDYADHHAFAAEFSSV